MSNHGRIRRNDLTVMEAVQGYIQSKKNVLSPSTIYAYTRYLPKYQPIAKLKISNITSDVIQVYINTLSAENSPKYVKNIYTLLSSAIALYQPDIRLKVTLPKTYTPRLNVPLEGDIARLVELSDGYMKLAICLAGFCSMRRGEICALKYADIDRESNRIHVHADMVTDENYQWIYKDIPKTEDGNRIIDCPQFVVELIEDGNPDDYIIPVVPLTISKNFAKIRQKAGIDIRFHDLRSFFASSLTAMGIPDIYISQQGGWKKGSSVMKKHYQRIMDNKKSKFSAESEAYFSAIIQKDPLST